MTDPRRLVDEGADDFEVRLLRAARRDTLSLGGRRRILAGLGFGGVISATLAASTAEAGVRGWVSSLGPLRLLAGGSVGALAVWAGVQALSPAPVAKPPSGHVHVVVPAPVEKVDVGEAALPTSTPPVVEQAAAPGPTEKEAAPKPVPTPRVERAQDSLPAELSALDQARAALSRRDASGALRLLDDYARHFPKRRLDTEATVLRIEALVARGDRTTAARLGKEFLARQPNGPYARRVSSLVADPTHAAKAEP